VVIADRMSGAFVALAHLRAGSIQVRAGDEVTVGPQLAECGNSGNSTQPHVHLQVMDGPDPNVARGVPMLFRSFRECLEAAGTSSIATSECRGRVRWWSRCPRPEARGRRAAVSSMES
jgi:murein DD-endopeptidase MepM/ murein hydrolase activator NlpD